MLPESSSDMESDVPNGFNLSDAEELLSSEDDAASDGLKEDESGDEDSPEEAAFKDVQNLEKEKGKASMHLEMKSLTRSGSLQSCMTLMPGI